MIEDCQFAEDDVNIKQIVCKVCAQKCVQTSCCLSNQLTAIIKQQYIKGNRNEQLREMISLFLEEDNVCNKHGFVFEFVMGDTLHCKKCLIEVLEKIQKEYSNYIQIGQQQHQITKFEKIILFNDEYLMNLFKSERVVEDINNAFNTIQQSSNYFQQKIDQISTLKQDLINEYKNALDRNTEQKQRLNEQQIQQLQELKKAFEIRLGAISQTKEGFHDFLHDDFCEELQIRQKILGDSQTLEFHYCALEIMLEKIKALQQNQQI